MLTAEELREVIVGLDRTRLARLAWRYAVPGTDAAVGVEVATGELAVLTTPAGSSLPTAPGVVILRRCTAWRRAETERALRNSSDIPASLEVVEEHASREGAKRPLYWPYIDEQIEAIERRAA